MNASTQIAVRTFGRKAVKTLARKGIVITGLQAIPDMTSSLPFASSTTGYIVNDNGTGRVLTYAQIQEAL